MRYFLALLLSLMFVGTVYGQQKQSTIKGKVKGITSGAAAATGDVGERIVIGTGSISNATYASRGDDTYANDFSPVNVGAGAWLITARHSVGPSGAGVANVGIKLLINGTPLVNVMGVDLGQPSASWNGTNSNARAHTTLSVPYDSSSTFTVTFQSARLTGSTTIQQSLYYVDAVRIR